VHHTIDLVGFGGELLRAFARAGRRSRTFVELALVATLIGMPNATFVGDSWLSPERTVVESPDPRPRIHVSTLPSSSEPVARVAPAARDKVATAPPASPSAPPIQSQPAPVTVAGAQGGVWVHASWYGPGFYGNRTACGQTFTPESWGIAHKTLRCGTMVQITFRGRTISVPVIDRGPYIAGREVDLASAVAGALGFTGVQPVYLVIP
jgi:hypothetical protein